MYPVYVSKKQLIAGVLYLLDTVQYIDSLSRCLKEFFLPQTGDILLKKRLEDHDVIRSRLNHLILQWNELLKASKEKGAGLEEARDILAFNEEIGKVEDWMKEKVRTCAH